MEPGQEPDVANPLIIRGEMQLTHALAQIVEVRQEGASSDFYFRDGVYWVDLCLTPRRPETRGRYRDHWGAHRYSPMGPLFALPPGQTLHLRTAGGGHSSLVCQIAAWAVEQWLPAEFAWTDRRREACMDLASSTLRDLLTRLSIEVGSQRADSVPLAEGIVAQLAVEIARYLTAVSKPAENGGLAAWRLRIIDARLAQITAPPTLTELARQCDISVRQLTRGFRISRGCSIGAFMANGRIELAKRLLTSDQSIKAIGSAMGFTSQSNFSSTFRRATGTTPARYRSIVRLGGGPLP